MGGLPAALSAGVGFKSPASKRRPGPVRGTWGPALQVGHSTSTTIIRRNLPTHRQDCEVRFRWDNGHCQFTDKAIEVEVKIFTDTSASERA